INGICHNGSQVSGASVPVAKWRTRSLGAAKGHGRQGVAAPDPVRHLALTAWRTRSHSAAGTPSSPSHGPFLTKPTAGHRENVCVTAQNFTIGEMSADKAYASLENFEEVAACGGTGFLAFKSNTTGGV